MKRLILTVLLVLGMVGQAWCWGWSPWLWFHGPQAAQYIDLLPSLSWSPSTFIFGNASTGMARNHTFTLSNTGNDVAEGLALSITGGGAAAFRNSTTSCGTTLAYGSNCTQKVVFAPAVQGRYSSVLKLMWPNQPDLNARLYGTDIINSPPTTPVISVTPGDTQNVVALTNGGVGSTSFNLMRSLTTGTETNYQTGVSLPYTDSGLVNGTTYYYELAAINSNGTATSTQQSGKPVVKYSVSDDFSGTLSNWTQVAGSWSIFGGSLVPGTHDAISYLMYNTMMGTISQWGSFKVSAISAVGVDVQIAATCRWTSTAERYNIDYRRYYDEIEWTYAPSDSVGATPIALTSVVSLVEGDTIGWQITGTGSSTTLNLWINPGARPWGMANYTLTNSSGNYADTGLNHGLFSYFPYGNAPTINNYAAGDQ